MPELQGEPEDISKEKARLAAIQVLSLSLSLSLSLIYIYIYIYICINYVLFM